jgi:hypothetical protein
MRQTPEVQAFRHAFNTPIAPDAGDAVIRAR